MWKMKTVILEFLLCILCCSFSAQDLKLLKWFPLAPEFSNSARVYWVSESVVAINGSVMGEASKIGLINIETKKRTIITNVKDNDKLHVLRIISVSPRFGIFIYSDETEMADRKWKSNYYVFDVSSGQCVNIDNNKDIILKDPKKYFRGFRYYFKEEYPEEGTKIFYELFRIDNFTMERERLLYVHPKEWLNSDYNYAPVLRDYNERCGLILLKYCDSDPQSFGDYYIGEFDGNQISNIRKVNFSESGDAKILDKNRFISIGNPMEGDFYSLLVLSWEGSMIYKIKDMYILNNSDNISINHDTDKLAVIGYNQKYTNHGVFIYGQ